MTFGDGLKELVSPVFMALIVEVSLRDASSWDGCESLAFLVTGVFCARRSSFALLRLTLRLPSVIVCETGVESVDASLCPSNRAFEFLRFETAFLILRRLAGRDRHLERGVEVASGSIGLEG